MADTVSAQAGAEFAPTITNFLPFHDSVTTPQPRKPPPPSQPLRKLNLQYVTWSSTSMEGGTIRDSPALVHRRGRGRHAFSKYAMEQIFTAGEVLRQIHRGRDAHPHTSFYAEHSVSGDVRLPFAVP